MAFMWKPYYLFGKNTIYRKLVSITSQQITKFGPVRLVSILNMSDQNDEEIAFTSKTVDGSQSIAFEVVETFQQGDKTGSKLTTNFHLGSKYGDDTFFATYYKPGADEKIAFDSLSALVFICHGYAEYVSDSYDELAKHLSTQLGDGCLVFGHDHIGHGRTTAGERVLINEMDDFVDPVIAHIEAVQKWTSCSDKKLPVFILGHSMGGLISLFSLFKKQTLFKVINLRQNSSWERGHFSLYLLAFYSIIVEYTTFITRDSLEWALLL